MRDSLGRCGRYTLNAGDSLTPELCPRCGTRPVTVTEPDITTDPPSILRLCEPCFAEDMNARLQAFVRKAGTDLDTAFAASGHPLPPTMTGEQMIRAFLEESRKEGLSEAGRQRQSELTRITQEVAASLPGGSAHADFMDIVSAKYKEWLDHHRDGTQ